MYTTDEIRGAVGDVGHPDHAAMLADAADQIDAMAPVVRAAMAWRDARCLTGRGSASRLCMELSRLMLAIDAYAASQDASGKTGDNR